MNWYKIFYWITVADTVKGITHTFAIITTVMFVAAFIIWIAALVNYGDEVQYASDTSKKSLRYWLTAFRRMFMWSFSIGLVLWLGYAIIPSKRDCLLIVAGGAVGNFVSTDSSSRQIPGDITKFLHISLEKEISELSKESKSEVKKEMGMQSPKDKLIQNVEEMTKEELIKFIDNDSTLFK